MRPRSVGSKAKRPARPGGDPQSRRPRKANRSDQTRSLSAFSGTAFTTFRAGLALIVHRLLGEGVDALLGLGRRLADDLELEQTGELEEPGALLAELAARPARRGCRRRRRLPSCSGWSSPRWRRRCRPWWPTWGVRPPRCCRTPSTRRPWARLSWPWGLMPSCAWVATDVGPIGPGLPNEAERRGSCRSFSTRMLKTYRKSGFRGSSHPVFPRFFRVFYPERLQIGRKPPANRASDEALHGQPVLTTGLEPHEKPPGRREHRDRETRPGEGLGAPRRLLKIRERAVHVDGPVADPEQECRARRCPGGGHRSSPVVCVSACGDLPRFVGFRVDATATGLARRFSHEKPRPPSAGRRIASLRPRVERPRGSTGTPPARDGANREECPTLP